MSAAIVESIVAENIKNKKSFSAYDITTEIRSKNVRIAHSVVRDYVHDLYARGIMTIDYERIVKHFGQNQAYLYQPKVASNVVNNSVIQIPISSIDDGDDGDDDGDDLLSNNAGVIQIPLISIPSSARNSKNLVAGRVSDKRGTLSIPVYLVKNLGVSPKAKIYAVSEGNKVILSSQKPQNKACEYTVDKYNQVRISKACLAKSHLSGKSFNLFANNSSIEISQS